MLLRHATLLHLDPPAVEAADVRVADGRITEVAPDLAPAAGEVVRDLRGSWLMPGLVVGHHHLYSALATGMPLPAEEPPDFPAMLAAVWWKLDRALDREAVAVSALVGGLAALRAGVTTVVDHHASPNFIVGSLEVLDEALGALGLRRLLCYEVSDRGGREEARAGLRAHEALLAEDGGGMRAVLVGGHANFTLSDATLRDMAAMARAAGTGLHLHLAEAAEDRAVTGEPLVARLDRLGALLPGSLFAHAVHLDQDELARLEAAGAWVSHQPRSNMNNRVGHAPLRWFGERAVLGTDGIGADMLAELQAGFFRAREAGEPWGPGRFLAALAAGARFAGAHLGVRLGRIEPGAAADLVVCDPQPGPPLSAANLAASLVFRLGAGMVRDVMVAGRWRLLDRQPLALDPAELAPRAEAAARALWARMA